MIWDDSSLAMTRGRRQRGTRDSVAWMIYPEGEEDIIFLHFATMKTEVRKIV